MTTATTTEKPILFSTELVQAILDGRKSQTRRIVKADEKGRVCRGGTCIELDKEHGLVWDPYAGSPKRIYPDPEEYCPYGYPGNELWVRETFAFLKEHDNKPPSEIYDNQVLYKAGEKITNQFGLGTNIHKSDFGRWRPSIHMPRRYSRIQLAVEDIRVERVQEITEEDAIAEGCINDVEIYTIQEGIGKGTKDYRGMYARERFRELWDEINADRGYSWESNPYVWVVEFKVKNIK